MADAHGLQWRGRLWEAIKIDLTQDSEFQWYQLGKTLFRFNNVVVL
jgi:hypothetical protein